MATAPYCIPGFQYLVIGGQFEGHIVTVLDNHPIPDTDLENRRKILVHDEDENSDIYILPRFISDKPVGVSNPAIPAHVLTSVQDAPRPGRGPVEEPVVEEEPMPSEGVTVELLDAQGVRTGNTVTTTLVQGPGFKPITDPMDWRLDKWRPTRSPRKRYVSRTMKNGLTDLKFLLKFTNDAYRAKNEGYPASVIIKGDTQCGKTMLVRVLAWEWAEVLGYDNALPVFTLSGSIGVTEYQLYGQPAVYIDPATGQSVLVRIPGVLELVCMAGGILYLDEPNAMQVQVTTAMFSFLDERHEFVNPDKPVNEGGVIMPEVTRAPFDTWVLASMNDDNYQGMAKLNEAFKNRFNHILWDYDPEVEKELVPSEAIRLMGERLRTTRQFEVGIRTPIGTSKLMEAETNAREQGIEMALEMVIALYEVPERKKVREIIEQASIAVLWEQEMEQEALDDQAIDAHEQVKSANPSKQVGTMPPSGIGIQPPKF